MGDDVRDGLPDMNRFRASVLDNIHLKTAPASKLRHVLPFRCCHCPDLLFFFVRHGRPPLSRL
jgi:hypothetical protein